jgi:phage-related protein
MTQSEKPLLWLHGEIRTPPFSLEARIEAGVLLRRLQRGESLGMPHSRPMRSIGRQVYELRINDETTTWRIVYHVATDAIVILDIFAKKSQLTPQTVIVTCHRRLQQYAAVDN